MSIQHNSVADVVRAYRKEKGEPKRLEDQIAKLEKDLAESRMLLESFVRRPRPAEAAMIGILRSMPKGAALTDFRTLYHLKLNGQIVETDFIPSYEDSLDTHFRSLGILADPFTPHVELTPPADDEAVAEPVNGDLVEA